MTYEIRFKEGALGDLETLDKGVRKLVVKQLAKLSAAPQLGDALGHIHGYDLSGYRKMYADKKRIRIVYRIIDGVLVVEVVAVGERDGMTVYKAAYDRRD